MSRRSSTEPRKRPFQVRSRQTVDVIIEGAAQVFERHAMEDVGLLLKRNPRVRVPDIPTAAYLVVQTVESLTHRYVADAPPIPRRELVGEVIALLRGYLMR